MTQYPDAPGHRNVDTSIAAADGLAADLGRLQRVVLDVIRAAGAYGMTSEEVAVKLGQERWATRPRTSELRRKGMILDSGQRRPNNTGKMAIVWIAR